MDSQHQKLRLKVCTNTGLNIMCTVNKDWTVDKLYPHITSLYKQVTEDQGGNHVSVHITTLKRNTYFIPKSQIVGQIFNDGDEVTCNVEVKFSKGGSNKKEKKDEKKNQKNQQKKKEESQKQTHKRNDKSSDDDKSNKKVQNKSRQKHNEKKQIKQNQEENDHKIEYKKKKNKNKKSKDHSEGKKELKVPRQQLIRLFQSHKDDKKLNKENKQQQNASQNQEKQKEE